MHKTGSIFFFFLPSRHPAFDYKRNQYRKYSWFQFSCNYTLVKVVPFCRPFQAGIKGKDLLIALEPESASLFCHHLPAEKCAGKGDTLTTFQPGTKYLVLDAGGMG